MQKMTAILDEQLWKKMQKHSKILQICKMRAAGIDNAEGKQRNIELYDKFFKTAF
jgi:predicted helicase